jgi:two-component system response regulator MprA
MRCDGREARPQPGCRSGRSSILLDVLMHRSSTPGGVAGVMRDTGDRTPVLLLTALRRGRDRVAGLEAGADD